MSEYLPLGDEELRRHDHELRRLARRVVSTQADAEDVVQDVWLRSLENPPRHDGQLRAWWRTVTRNTALRRLGREHHLRAHLRDVARPEAAALDTDDEGSRAAVERLIARLDDPYREVLRLRYLEDLTPAEIGRRLQRPEVTVRSQVKRGLDQLRQRAGERERFLLAPLFLRLRARVPRPLRFLAAGALVLLGGLALLRWTSTDTTRAAELAQAGAVEDAPGAGTELDRSAASPQRELLAVGEAPAAVREAPPAPPLHDVAGVVTWLAEVVPGAEIHASATVDEPGERVGVADAEGRFQVRVLASSLVWAEDVRRDGEVELQRKRSKRYQLGAAPAEGLNLEFVYLREVPGELLDADGAPLAGARVLTHSPGREPSLGAQGWLEHSPLASEARTDAAGRFRFPVGNDGPQTLLIGRTGRPTLPVETGASPQGERIRLPHASALRGRLVDGDGHPLADAEIRLRSSFGPLEPMARTDEAGRWSAGEVPPGAFELAALPAEGELSLIHPGRVGPGQELDLGDLVARPAFTVRGRVVERGLPCEGWRVLLAAEGARGQARTQRTEADGSFSFRGCGDESYTLTLTAPEGRVLRGRFAEVRPGGAPLALDVPPLSATLRAHCAERGSGSLFLCGDGLEAPLPFACDARSVFECALLPGRYEVHEFVPGVGDWSHGPFELAPGEVRTLELVPPRTGSLGVRLSVPEGLEREKLVFTLRGAGTTSQVTSARPGPGVELDLASGELRYLALLPGEYRFDVRGPGVGLAERTVVVQADEETALALALEPGQRVSVRCRGERELVRGESVSYRLRSAAGEVVGKLWTERLDASGETQCAFRRDLAAGEYEFQAESSHGLTGTLRFTVPGPLRHTLLLRASEPGAATATR